MDEATLIRRLEAFEGPGEEETCRRARHGLPAALGERFGAQARTESGRRLGRPRSRRLLIAAALAAVALAVALPVLLLGGNAEVEPAAAQVLREAARVARSQPPEPQPGPGQYVYTRSQTAYLTTVVGLMPAQSGEAEERRESAPAWSVLVPREREIWIAPNGSGRIRERAGTPRFLSAAQRAAWVAAGSPQLPAVARASNERFGPGELRYFRSGHLPSDPKALRKLIEAREVPGINGPPGEAETFELIGEMLRETDLRPALRAAIYAVAAELPGVELLGEVRDPAGRLGVGVAFTDRRQGIRKELIFDPGDSALLGERQVVVGGPSEGLQVPAGTVIGYAAYLESRVVDSTAIRSRHKPAAIER